MHAFAYGMGLPWLALPSRSMPWGLIPHLWPVPDLRPGQNRAKHGLVRSGQRLPKYIARAFAGFWVAWPHLRVKCPGAASWLFVCNVVLMGSWAGYADSGLALCKQVGDRPRLFATVGLTGCLPWHPGHLGMY